MQPTYSFQEIKELVRTLDLPALDVLSYLVDEESDCYNAFELRAITRFIKVRSKAMVHNEVKLEFLLSFN